MSYQPPAPGQQGPPQPAAVAGKPGVMGAFGSPETQQLDELLVKNGVLNQDGTIAKVDPGSAPPQYGEMPGLGYWFAPDPWTRHATLVTTEPEFVRNIILRTMEVAAWNAALPYGEGNPKEWGELMLKAAQAYLLIDPEVDAEGVSIAGKQMASTAGAMAQQEHKVATEPPPAPGAPANPNAKTVPSAQVGGHVNPPRLAPNVAEQILQSLHGNLETVLRGSHASNPRPRPRVSG